MSYFKFNKLKIKVWMKWSGQTSMDHEFSFPILSLSQKALIVYEVSELAQKLKQLEECKLYLNVMGKWKKHELTFMEPRPLESEDKLGRIKDLKKYSFIPFTIHNESVEMLKRDLMLAYGK